MSETTRGLDYRLCYTEEETYMYKSTLVNIPCVSHCTGRWNKLRDDIFQTI